MKKIIVIMLLSLITQVYADNYIPEGISDDIALAIKTGNSKELAKHFASSIDLTIPGYEGVYSKAQAEQIIKDFFNKFLPTSFSIIHQGASKDGSQYYIGNYVSSGKKFRTYFLLKKSNDGSLIQQLRFETE